ncbi:hypothetical protein BH11PLA2_BH11PLA2_32360 [soil metagenome]
MVTLTLFDIGNDLRAYDDLVDETGGEITSVEAEQALDAFISELHQNQGAKLDGYGNLIRREESYAAAARATAEQFLAKEKTYLNRAKWLKARLLAFLLFTKQKKATSDGGWQFTVVTNGGSVPVKLEEGITPEDPRVWRFVRSVTTESIDTAAVRAALEAGEVIPWATLAERGSHLRIK